MIDRSRRRHSRWLAPAVGLCAVLFAACLETPAVQCADGRVCPAGRACDDVHGGCVLPEQLSECEGQPDETACSYRGVPDGVCFDEVCFPAGCGNGELEEGEACDDGNRLHGDGCSADCSSNEECGNGFADTTLGESCDDGKHCQSLCDDGTPCTVDAECAGIGGETCNLGASCDDDADCAGIGDGLCVPRDGDDCQANCASPACGDGVVDLEFLEACDLGADNADEPDAQCRTNCQPQRCGDLIVDPAAGENCDDGNLFPGDGCSGDCVVEECGNGVVDLEEVDGSFLPSEECDDGENGLNHDGCAIDCNREAPVWTGPPAALPSPRSNHAMAYDAARGKIVLFGGVDGNSLSDGETWEYDGATQTWTQVPVASPDAPSPRRSYAMAYDAARGKVVLFGGSDNDGRNGETWEYDGATQTWTQVPVASPDAPTPRIDHAMAYDAARGRVVLFGGDDNAGRNGETWEYDGATQTWTQVPVADPDAPSPRQRHAMAYDAARGKVVLFGGFDGALDGETWEYDGATQTWTQVPVADPDAPSPRERHAMAYDAARGKVVLFGGSDGASNSETWEYDGATQSWTQVPVADPDAPSPRERHAMAYDAARGKVVLFGGIVGDFFAKDGETWEYDGATQTWTQVPVANPDAPSTRERHAMAYDAARGKVVLFGGQDAGGLNGETWEYDGATLTWTQVPVADPDAPSPRQLHAMAYDAAREKVVLFGGGLGGETWEYDGATQTWTQVPVAAPDAPSPRRDHAMAYDAARGKVVLFGGFDEANDSETWEYDGATQTWTQVPVADPDAPSPRRAHAMAYDAARGKVVLFGGFDEAFHNGETWEYDGVTQTWTQVPVADPDDPSPRRDHAMAYDAARGKVVLFGGLDGPFHNGETWEYDGATQTWTQIFLTSPDAPSPRRHHAMAYVSVRGNSVLFGGNDGAGNDETWTFQHSAGIAEACTTGFDGDADGLVGCDDPDCWGRCTPHCPVSSTPDWPNDCDTAEPHCGDGVCNAFLETPRLCPGDCGPPTPVCGDFHCDDAEDATSCPGDCTP